MDIGKSPETDHPRINLDGKYGNELLRIMGEIYEVYGIDENRS